MEIRRQCQGIERQAKVFNVQKYNTYDGPGVRTLIFFKGCPVRCKWCANPEGLERKTQIMFKRNNCIDCGKCVPVCPVGIHQMDTNGTHYVNRQVDCIGCNKCVDVCLYNALSVVGEEKSISELLEIIEEDRLFYDMSGGGMTLGGGECTAQPEAAASLLTACQQAGIHTAIETSGYCSPDKLLQIAESTDLFLFDIKHMDPEKHLFWTGVNNEIILDNLEMLLNKGYNVQIRMPLLKDVNDQYENIQAVIDFLKPYRDYPNFKGIDLLPYHKLGVNKYEQVDRPYPIEGDPSLSDEKLAQIESWLKEYDFPVTLVRH